eukprot:752354_1
MESFYEDAKTRVNKLKDNLEESLSKASTVAQYFGEKKETKWDKLFTVFDHFSESFSDAQVFWEKKSTDEKKGKLRKNTRKKKKKKKKTRRQTI